MTLVFDRPRVRVNRRKISEKIKDHSFLHDFVLQNLTDRLFIIRREFRDILLMGARSSAEKDPFFAQGRLAVMDMDASLLKDRDAGTLVADEEHLPFAPGSFDLVLNNMTLHTVNDLPGALIQIRRTLRPDGVFLGAFPGGQTLHELRDCLMQAEMTVTGGVSPRIAPMADKQQIGALMQRAHYALPVVDSEIITVSYKDIESLLRDIRGMGESNAALTRSRRPLHRSILAEANRLYRERYSDNDGRIRATFEIIFMIGWAPHESQQKPLRPGSAVKSLADTLGTEEIAVGEKARP